MSVVTNVILTAHVGPQGGSDSEIDSVNKFLKEARGGGFGTFTEVSDHAGGPKRMECPCTCQPLTTPTLKPF
jgi:hypothetical protein